MQAFWHFMAFYGILAFLPKSLIRNQIRLFQFYPTFSDFRLFPTFRLSDSTALACIHPFFLLYRMQGHKRYRGIVLNKVHNVQCGIKICMDCTGKFQDMQFFVGGNIWGKEHARPDISVDVWSIFHCRLGHLLQDLVW